MTNLLDFDEFEIVPRSIEIQIHYPFKPEQGYDPPLRFIERAGRVCYKSEEKITESSSEKFVKMIKKRGHHSVLEHCVASAHLVCGRGETHEIVRHRLCSYSQESTRYCDYGNGKLKVVQPFFVGTDEAIKESIELWIESMKHASRIYKELRMYNQPPEIAREVLPTCTKTEIWWTGNLREWMHILNLRANPKAHPHLRYLMNQAKEYMVKLMPEIFGDENE